MKNFQDWFFGYNDGNPDDRCPDEIWLPSCSVHTLSKWLCIYVAETKSFTICCSTNGRFSLLQCSTIVLLTCMKCWTVSSTTFLLGISFPFPLIHHHLVPPLFSWSCRLIICLLPWIMRAGHRWTQQVPRNWILSETMLLLVSNIASFCFHWSVILSHFSSLSLFID